MNPAHLTLGTSADNNAAMMERGRHRSQIERNLKLSGEELLAIRNRHGDFLIALASEFSITIPMLKSILKVGAESP